MLVFVLVRFNLGLAQGLAQGPGRSLLATWILFSLKKQSCQETYVSPCVNVDMCICVYVDICQETYAPPLCICVCLYKTKNGTPFFLAFFVGVFGVFFAFFLAAALGLPGDVFYSNCTYVSAGGEPP